MTYTARAERRDYLQFSEPMRTVTRFVGIVEWTQRGQPPDKADTTGAYVKESMAKAQATKLAKRYQAYYDREGERWEVLQRQKKAAAQERKRVAAVMARIEKDFRSLDAAEKSDVMKALRAIHPED
jgi:hypothetical protein